MKLIADWRVELKKWSTWLSGLGVALSSLFAVWPTIGLDTWNAMPVEVKAYLPQHVVTVLPAFLFASVIVAKFVQQKNIDGDEQA